MRLCCLQMERYQCQHLDLSIQQISARFYWIKIWASNVKWNLKNKLKQLLTSNVHNLKWLLRNEIMLCTNGEVSLPATGFKHPPRQAIWQVQIQILKATLLDKGTFSILRAKQFDKFHSHLENPPRQAEKPARRHEAVTPRKRIYMKCHT